MMRLFGRRKGQIEMLDFIAGAFIFMSALLLVIWVWNLSGETIWSFEETLDLKHRSLAAINTLSMTPGFPTNWEDESNFSANPPQAIGLVTSAYEFSEDKLDALESLDYNTTREILGLAREDFWLGIMDEEENVKFSYGVPNSGPAVLERLGIYDGEVVRFILALKSYD